MFRGRPDERVVQTTHPDLPMVCKNHEHVDSKVLAHDFSRFPGVKVSRARELAGKSAYRIELIEDSMRAGRPLPAADYEIMYVLLLPLEAGAELTPAEPLIHPIQVEKRVLPRTLVSVREAFLPSESSQY